MRKGSLYIPPCAPEAFPWDGRWKVANAAETAVECQPKLQAFSRLNASPLFHKNNMDLNDLQHPVPKKC